jgi:phosphate transport system permease protein
MLAFPKNIDQIKMRNQRIMFWIARGISYSIIAILILILFFILKRGIGVINWEFFSTMPKEGMTKGGILPAIIGTLYLVAGSMIIAFPIGMLSGIYVNEYAREGQVKRFIKLMTNNLAGVPSIVFGLFGMALFVNQLNFGASILAGSLTLALLALPLIIRTTEESLKAVDNTFRHASYALGASKLYTIRKVVVPIAFPNIITGLILGIGRVSGETAPILFTVAAYFLPRLPNSVFDQCMALPYHLYVISTSGTDIETSRPIAYGTAVVLIAIVLFVNLLANFLRNYFSRKVKMK